MVPDNGGDCNGTEMYQDAEAAIVEVQEQKIKEKVKKLKKKSHKTVTKTGGNYLSSY